MRGLNIRVAFVMVKLGLIANPTGEELFFVCLDAQGEGWHDQRAGESLPLMFADEPMLREAWMAGARAAEIDVEIDSCGFCNEDTDDPCPSHG
ncbi:hypothetical protein CRM94_17290 [Burkholderia gladioli]|uniref:Uncharacterized protein n=1 Tax=Burkholderia gladioli TaxID=28095 RepID=A0A2A7SA94_BURGA|nr:hypothetical protein [Burkholderia gladioli]PEH40468.1 hypothetical protein CRM94_17290 [Burkholderia gladioli]